MDAVEEFPILSGGKAEYGRSAGDRHRDALGHNDWHGAVFEYYRNEGLGARNYFNAKPQPKNEFSNHQFGASLGGPIVEDRTFFFLAYEGQREEGGIPGPFKVPTAAELADAIAANGGGVNPVTAGLLARQPWPSPNQAPDDAGNNLQATTPFSNDLDNLIVKLDHHFAKSDLLTLRYFYGTSDQSFPFALGSGGLLPGFNTVTPTTVSLVSASLTHVLSPKLLLELRGGYNRFHEDFFPEDNGFDPNSIGLNTVSDPQNFGLPRSRSATTRRSAATTTCPAAVSTRTGRASPTSPTRGTPPHEARLRVPPHARRPVSTPATGRAEFRKPRRLRGRARGRRPAGARRLQPRDVPEQPRLLLPGQLPAVAAPHAELRPRWDYYGVLGEAGIG